MKQSLFMSGFRVGISLFMSGFHLSCRDFTFRVGISLFVLGFRTSIFALLGFHKYPTKHSGVCCFFVFCLKTASEIRLPDGLFQSQSGWLCQAPVTTLQTASTRSPIQATLGAPSSGVIWPTHTTDKQILELRVCMDGGEREDSWYLGWTK